MAGDKLYRAAVERKTPQQIECEQLERECHFRKYRELVEELTEDRGILPSFAARKESEPYRPWMDFGKFSARSRSSSECYHDSVKLSESMRHTGGIIL